LFAGGFVDFFGSSLGAKSKSASTSSGFEATDFRLVLEVDLVLVGFVVDDFLDDVLDVTTKGSISISS
jgi:hypothetical protein